MPSYYYVDMFFDGELGPVVEATVAALSARGARFKSATCREPESEGIQPFFAGKPPLTPETLASQAALYLADRRMKGRDAVSFPPWGRVLYGFPFEFDEHLAEDLAEEEALCHSSARDIGISFFDEPTPSGETSLVRATISFWEDYVLTLGHEETHELNMGRMLALIEAIHDLGHPFFGAAGPELHLDANRSLKTFVSGAIPMDAEFILAGRKVLSHIDPGQIESPSVSYRVLSDGGLLIQTLRRWS